MATAIERIRSKNRQAATLPQPAASGQSAAAAITTPGGPSPEPQPRSAWPIEDPLRPLAPTITDRPALPPPIPCLICSCPAVWATIYEPDVWKCCDCEPPPGGWHWLKGGWSFVRRRLMLVLDYGAEKLHPSKWARHFVWENFNCTDWRSFEI